MRFIKTLPKINESLQFTHSIYELSPEEIKVFGKKYLVNQNYSNYAMEKMNHMELLTDSQEEAEHTYGVGFFDTITECELFYKATSFECAIIDIKFKLKNTQERLSKTLDYINDAFPNIG